MLQSMGSQSQTQLSGCTTTVSHCVHTPHVHTHHIFIHSSVDGHLDCFHAVANVNCAAVNIGMLMSFQITVFSGYVPRIGISGSYGNSF